MSRARHAGPVVCGGPPLRAAVRAGLTRGMKIVIAGSGAMGCRYGAALFESGHDVTLLDGWAGHVAAINDGGLRVTDESGTRLVPVPADADARP